MPDLERLRPFLRLFVEFVSFECSVLDSVADTGGSAMPAGFLVSVPVFLAGGVTCLTVGVVTEGTGFAGCASDGGLLLSVGLIDFGAVDLRAEAFLFSSPPVFVFCHA